MLNSCWMHINSGGLFSTLKKIYILKNTSVFMSTHKSMRRFRGELKGEWPGLIYTVKLPKICLGSPWKTSISLGPSQVKIFWICTWSPMQYLSTVQCTHLFQNMSTFSVHTFSPSIIVCQQFKCIHMYRICQHIQLVQYHHFKGTWKSEVTVNISGARSDSTPFTV